MNINRFNHYRKGVSPIIAIVLLIALTVASAAIIWALTQGILDVGGGAELVIENAGVADTTDNDLGDLMRVIVRNIGAETAEVRDVVVEINGVEASSWVLNETLDIDNNNQDQIWIKTLDFSDMITSLDNVIIYFTDGEGVISNLYNVGVPGILSSQAILYESGTNISTEDLAAQGWTEVVLGTHPGGGSGDGFEVTPQNPNDITVSTNYDLLFVLMNDDFLLTNFLLSTSITNGDDDALGFVFNYQDEDNYYWVGVTSNHHSSTNRAGDPTNGNIPYFGNNRNAIVFGKVENGVTSRLDVGSVDPTLAGQVNTVTWTKTFTLFVSDGTFGLEVDGQEMLTVSDNTFTSGYIGLMAIAGFNSRFSNIIIQR